MKSLIVGHGGREAALGSRMAESSSLYAFMGHDNPTLIAAVSKSGGKFAVGDICDGKAITDFASDNEIDIVLVSSDDPLANGVIDNLLAAGIQAVGPNKAGAEIEWNKSFSRQIVRDISPESNPDYRLVTNSNELDEAISTIGKNGYVVVKPLGLTGGKGVKVVGPHLENLEAAKKYASDLLRSTSGDGAVIIEERIQSPEFTIQAMTDGKTVFFPPATYDYPYRFEGDKGPGTGGMGSCSLKGGLFPFLTQDTYDKACEITRNVIAYLAEEGRHFSGCMNAGFFATEEGPKVIEFNSRFGDPEAMNIMSLLESDLIDVLISIANQELQNDTIKVTDKSSIVTYLVAPEYALGKSVEPKEFTVDLEVAGDLEVDVFFSAAEKIGKNLYKTVGISRAVAFVATDNDIETARLHLQKAISRAYDGPLEWRNDIGILPSW